MKSWLTGALAVFLAACAQIPTRDVAEESQRSWSNHVAKVAALRNWSLQGRVAIRVEREGWNAGLRWTQEGDRYALRLVAPFGQGSYLLEGADPLVVMRTAENETLTASNPEVLMRESLGWSVPVGGLKYWVRGIPDPRNTFSELALDEHGRLATLSQAGWQISVQRYAREGDLFLPVKLFMENDRMSVRLAVQKWHTVLQ